MLRIGIVNFDTSHSIEFTRRINHVGVPREQCVDGAKIVLGCPGTSTMSPERIPIFQRQIVECGVDLVDQPSDLIGQVDAVMVLSLCGAAHRSHAELFLNAGLPIFVDKPYACSLADARAMAECSQSTGKLMFSTSALRFSEDVLRMTEFGSRSGGMNGCLVHGPAKRQAGNPGLFHYGIHIVEMMYALMGAGCESVATTHSDGCEVVNARWTDGRIATLRGVRDGSTAYGAMAFCDSAVLHSYISSQFAYRNLCQKVIKAFETGEAPVAHDVSIEIVRFILASLESEQAGGAPIHLASIKEDDD